ncbi:MAG: hypothetical protein IH957_01185 [Chloroflexi bacterium]|nr:hypothetical protein [Chloroflexota bacterium]
MRLMFIVSVMAAAAIVFLGCGSAEEVSQSEPQATSPTVSAPPTPSITPTPTDAPVATTPAGGGGSGGEIGPGTVITPPPKPSSGPIPLDWGTFTARDHTIRHPAGWYSTLGRVSSWTPGEGDVPATPFRADGIRIDYSIRPEPNPAPKEGSALLVDGLSGWEVVRSYDPSLARGIAQVHELFVERDGFFTVFVGYFGPDAIDEDLFWQIVSTFEPTP